MTNPNSEAIADAPFMSHLIELRTRLVRVVGVLLVVFVIIFSFFWEDIFKFLQSMVPEGVTYQPWKDLFDIATWKELAGNYYTDKPVETKQGTLQAVNPITPFFTSVSLSFSMSLILLTPYILIELWGFVAPGLYKHERRLAIPLLVSSVILFYIGMAFARFVVLPIFFGFIVGYTPESVVYMPDMKQYIDFIMKIFFAFGLAFEVPIATMILCWSGLTTPDKLVEKRPYIIVGAFVVGMLLTPPDLFSQTFLAIPMWLLFELGIIMARFYKPAPKDDAEDDDFTDPGPYDGGGPTGGSGGSGGNTLASETSGNSRLTNESKVTATASTAAGVLPSAGTDSSAGSDAVSEAFGAAGTEADEDLQPRTYDDNDDYKPLSDEELDAELDKFDREMEELDRAYDEEQAQIPEEEPQSETASDSESDTDRTQTDTTNAVSSEQESDPNEQKQKGDKPKSEQSGSDPDKSA